VLSNVAEDAKNGRGPGEVNIETAHLPLRFYRDPLLEGTCLEISDAPGAFQKVTAAAGFYPGSWLIFSTPAPTRLDGRVVSLIGGTSLGWPTRR
jgi:hypothetical protein